MRNGNRNAAGFVTPDSPRSRTAEEFRVIKRPLIANASGKSAGPIADANLVMVTSSIPGEGKTFCLVNLAMSIAMELDRTVLLVDADVARPALPRTLGLPEMPGLLDVLQDGSLDLSQVLVRTNVDKLSFLSSGLPHPRAAEMLASDAMSRLLREVSTRYDDRIVIFDSPPLLVTTEARAIAARMGQVVFVVQSDHTLQADVERALATIEDCPVKMVVLNKPILNMHSDTGSDVGRNRPKASARRRWHLASSPSFLHRSFRVLWQQSSHQLLCRYSLDTQSLASSLRSSLTLNLCSSEGTPVGDKADQLFIGGTLNRASGDTDLDCISVYSDTFRSCRVRLNMHGQEHAALTVSCQAGGPHEITDSEDGFDEFENRPLHIHIIGNRTGNGHITGSRRWNALLDQRPGIDQESGTDAFFQTVVSEIADFLAELDQICRNHRFHFRFTLNHSRFDVRSGVIKFDRHETLLRALLQEQSQA